MTVGLQFTPLYGAQGGDPLACLLRIGPVTLLLDCGWGDGFDLDLLQPLMAVLPQVDLVLLSQPDAAHVGALPYLVGQAGLSAPVYATAPIARLGPMFMYDHYTSMRAMCEFDTFGPQDIDAAFDAIATLKHHQPLSLIVKGVALTLVAYPAGHMVGGSIWLVQSGGEVVVYGPHTNHMKERYLNGGQLSKVPVRPALMVLGVPRGVAAGHSGGKRRDVRDAALEEALRQVFRRGGNAILPVDSAGRLFEVLLVLEQMWQKQSFPYSLALLSCVADSALAAASSLLEWMSDELLRDFNRDLVNPFRPGGEERKGKGGRAVAARCHSVSDVMRLPTGSKVVLATGLSLDRGLARELLLSWGADSRNAVIYTQLPRPGSLGAQLLSAGAARPLNLHLMRAHREPLMGAELEEFEAKRAAAAEAAALAAEAAEEAAAAAAAAGGGGGGGAAVHGGDASALLPMRESSEVISQLKRGATGTMEQVLLGGEESFEEYGLVDTQQVLMDGFAPPRTAMFCMFPDECEQLQQDWDAFGAVVDTDAMKQDEDADAGLASLIEEDEMDVEEDVPTKVVLEQVHLPFAASVSFVDGFAGLSDPRSLATFVEGIVPRGLLLLGASAADTSVLADVCAKVLKDKLGHQVKLYQPASGQEVTLRLAPSFRLVISPQLLAGLSLHSLNEGAYQVSWLDGLLAAPSTDPRDAAAAADGGGEGAATGQQAGGVGATPGDDDEQQQQQAPVGLKLSAEAQERLLVLMPPGAAAPAAAAAAARADSMDVDGDEGEQGGDNKAAAAAAAADTAAKQGMVVQSVDLGRAGSPAGNTAAAAAAGGAANGVAAPQDAAPAATAAEVAAAAAEAAAAAADAAEAAADAAEAAAERVVGDHGGIFIGDVQLSEVKAALARAGVPCEFRTGTRALHVGPLAVRRDGPGGQLLLEGPMCEEYYTVRDVVYGLYNVC